MPENKSTSLWDASECALVLIDYQDNVYNVILSSSDRSVTGRRLIRTIGKERVRQLEESG